MMSVQICVYLEPVLCKGILTHTVILTPPSRFVIIAVGL